MTNRELDALVAEKVMEWSYQTFPDGPVPHVKHWYSTSPCPNDPSHESYRGLCSYYSTSDHDALRVVEKMHELGFDWNVCWPSGEDKVEVGFGRVNSKGETYASGYAADIFPRANSLAALKALGVEVPSE